MAHLAALKAVEIVEVVVDQEVEVELVVVGVGVVDQVEAVGVWVLQLEWLRHAACRQRHLQTDVNHRVCNHKEQHLNDA